MFDFIFLSNQDNLFFQYKNYVLIYAKVNFVFMLKKSQGMYLKKQW